MPPAFDLQARASLAARLLTRLLDPQRGGLMYFLADWQAKPPRAVHGQWDYGDGSGRHIDALTLAQRMTGDATDAGDLAREGQIEAWLLRQLGNEGLSWLGSEPCLQHWGAEMLLHGGPGSLVEDEALAEISWSQRGALLGLTSRFLATGGEIYLQYGKSLVQGLLQVAERHPDGLFFPEGYYRAGGWRFHQPGLYPGLEEVNAAVLVPLARFYRATGYSPALELALGIASFALKHTPGFPPDGGIQDGALFNHFHTRTNFVLGILEVGIVANLQEYIAWSRQWYERLKEWGTDLGWFPEGLGCRHGEICGTVDMIEMALHLGRQVDPVYYADAERFGRNHLLESQFLSLERLREAVGNLPEKPGPGNEEMAFSTTKGVVESQEGGFAARSTLNDAFHLDATAMMQCCNAAGTRGIYDLWRYAFQEDEPDQGKPARQKIHLRFSNEAPGLRVVSDEPYSGKLLLTNSRDCILEVRLPSGEKQATLSDPVTGFSQTLVAAGGYVSFHSLAGRVVELEYPLSERVTEYRVGTQGRTLECTGYWRGETLMRLEPTGAYYPLYMREVNLPAVQPALPALPLIDSLA